MKQPAQISPDIADAKKYGGVIFFEYCNIEYRQMIAEMAKMMTRALSDMFIAFAEVQKQKTPQPARTAALSGAF